MGNPLKDNIKECLLIFGVSTVVMFFLWLVFATLFTLMGDVSGFADYLRLAKILFIWFGAVGFLWGALKLFLGPDNEIADNMYCVAALYYIPAFASDLMSCGPYEDWLGTVITFFVVFAIVYGVIELIFK